VSFDPRPEHQSKSRKDSNDEPRYLRPSVPVNVIPPSVRNSPISPLPVPSPPKLRVSFLSVLTACTKLPTTPLALATVAKRELDSNLSRTRFRRVAVWGQEYREPEFALCVGLMRDYIGRRLVHAAGARGGNLSLIMKREPIIWQEIRAPPWKRSPSWYDLENQPLALHKAKFRIRFAAAP
jgi:hypothetical protein